MRIGIVVDSACDLPKEFLEEHKIVVMPITIHLGNKEFVDRREAEATKLFYAQHMSAMSDAATAPFSVEQIRELFLSQLVIDYDFVFCITIASSRSPIFNNATQASLSILNDYKPIRSKAGIAGPFALRVIDSKNLFAGQGVVAAEAARLVKARENPNKIRERLEFISENTFGYMLPKDLYYLRARGQKKGDRSVSWAGAFFGNALDIKPLIRGYRNETGPVAKLRHFDDGAEKLFKYVKSRVQKGLLSKTLTVGYGGDLTVLRALPGYSDLVTYARSQEVEVLESVMSITGAINVGEGCLGIAFADEPHELNL